MDKKIIIVDEKKGKTQEFIWDINKEKLSICRPGGLDFESASYVFFDKNRLTRFDTEHDDKEDRYQTIGKGKFFNINDPDNKTYFVISTEPYLDPDKPIRIISARKAELVEKNLYNAKNNQLEGVKEIPKKFTANNIEKDKNKQKNKEKKQEGKKKGR